MRASGGAARAACSTATRILLVSAMFEWFASHGLDRVELNVSAQNPAGLAFWRARGFEDFQHVMVRKVD
jgi:GNAT superfamily N-acetyltransferase